MRITAEEMERRKEHVLKVACEMFTEDGIDRVAQNDVADRAGVAHGTIQNYFGTYEGLKQQAVRYTCEKRRSPLLGQVAGHPKLGHLLKSKDISLAIRYLKA